MVTFFEYCNHLPSLPEKRPPLFDLSHALQAAVDQLSEKEPCQLWSNLGSDDVNDSFSWTEEEDEQLLKAVAVHGTRWIEIQKELNLSRSCNALRNRYKRLLTESGFKSQASRSKHRWTRKEDNAIRAFFAKGACDDPKEWKQLALDVKRRTRSVKERAKRLGIVKRKTLL